MQRASASTGRSAIVDQRRVNAPGIAAIVQQQFEIGRRIAEHGLMPIIEPEVSIKAPDKEAAEAILRDEIQRRLDALEGNGKVMLKLTIPSVPDLYAPLIRHARVQRVVALSGGYSRQEACRLLAAKPRNDRQLLSRADRPPARIDERHGVRRRATRSNQPDIYQASVHKT